MLRAEFAFAAQEAGDLGFDVRHQFSGILLSIVVLVFFSSLLLFSSPRLSSRGVVRYDARSFHGMRYDV